MHLEHPFLSRAQSFESTKISLIIAIEGINSSSIYTRGHLGDLSNLIGSLSRTIQQYSPPSEWIMCELGVFPIFQENKNDLLKVDKDFEVFKTAFFHLLQLSFELDGLFTASVYLAKKRPFRSLSFSLQEKFDPRIEVYL